MKSIPIVLTVLAASSLALAAEPAAESASATAATNAAVNPLAGLPSAPGPHIEKIKALGDNSWLDLGCPAPDPTQSPKEGVARGRSWGGRALRSAPDLRGAFFCGAGQHGYVKSDGHYMDDLWFYDINANRWICLYPGADTMTLKLHLDKDGFEVNNAGDPIPVSYLSHGYGNSTYNPDLRKFTIIWVQCPWWTQALPQRWEWLGIPADKRTYGNSGAVIPLSRHPLFWDVASGKWERRLVAGDGPKAAGSAAVGVAEYIPSMKKTFLAQEGRAWLYDYATNAWTALKSTGGPVGSGDNGCYDSRRERVWFSSNKTFAYYDLKANAYVPVEAEGQPLDFYCSNGTSMNFDAANGVIVFHMRYFGDPEKKVNHGTIMVYDPDANTWTRPDNTLPKLKSAYAHYLGRNGFYDAELNAHFCYFAGDSGNGDVQMMAYRYRNETK